PAAAALLLVLLLLPLVLLVGWLLGTGRAHDAERLHMEFLQREQQATAESQRLTQELREASQREQQNVYVSQLARAERDLMAGSPAAAGGVLFACPVGHRGGGGGSLRRQCRTQQPQGVLAERTEVTGIVWGTEANRFVTCGKDGRIKVWDARNGTFLTPVSEP